MTFHFFLLFEDIYDWLEYIWTKKSLLIWTEELFNLKKKSQSFPFLAILYYGAILGRRCVAEYLCSKNVPDEGY